MKNYLKLERTRILHSKRFWLTLFIGLCFAVLQFIECGIGQNYIMLFDGTNIKDYETSITQISPLPWYEYWMGGEGFGFFTENFFLLFPLLAVIPLGDSLATDTLSGYTMHMFISGKKKHYYTARFISAFIVGGIVIAFPLIINMLLYIATCPSICSEPANGTAPIFANSMWSYLFYKYPMIYELLYLIIDFTFGGIFSCLAVSVGMATRNRFLPYIFPFVLYVFSDTVLQQFLLTEKYAKLAGFSPQNFLPPSQHNVPISFNNILIVAIILLIPTVAIFVWNARKNETL